jgi:hypothetical protein
MIRNGYTSRNIPHPDMFAKVYEERLKAKSEGDKATANALKLVLNTTYGATLNQYNDLYDPLMARSVCISGQLYLLELACHLVRDVPTLKLIQLNTDGIMVSFDEEHYGALADIYHEWEERTGFALEEDEVAVIAQANVNNYALRMAGGKEKVKGGYLVRGASAAGAFSINENAVVVADALRRYLLDGTPVAETVRTCDDPARFQLVAKAGHKYREVYQEIVHGELADGTPAIEDRPVQKCNRVFATRDETLGRLYKVKAADGSVAKVESLPEHCLICNGGYPPIEDIDKEWYVALAERRAQDFEGEEMTENTTEKKPAAKRTARKAPDYKGMNVYQKLAAARRMFLDAGVRKSGTNDHAEYDYFELEDIVPAQTRIFEEVGLVELFRYVEPKWQPVSLGDRWEPKLGEPMAVATVVNADDPEQAIEFKLKWSEVPPIVNAKGKQVTTPIQRTGGEQTYMRRYLKMQVLDIVESDSVDSQDFEESADNAAKAEAAAKKAPSASKPASRKPATAAERKSAAKAVANADGAATSLQVRSLKSAIKKLKDEHGAEHPEVGQFIAELGASTDKFNHSASDEGKPFSKAECEAAIQKLGEMRERFETEGE